MIIKGRIISLGEVVGQPGMQKQDVVVEYPCDPENYKTVTLHVCGDERVKNLQRFKVGTRVIVELRGVWWLVMKDDTGYNVVMADSIEM